jgi:P-type Mg2+ transporter
VWARVTRQGSIGASSGWRAPAALIRLKCCPGPASDTGNVNSADPDAWWSVPADDVLAHLGSTPTGLSRCAASQRLERDGPNTVAADDSAGAWQLLARQLASPLVLILVVASVLSLLLREWVDAVVILAILGMGTLLGFWQEWRAGAAVARLRGRLALRARVWRDGAVQTVAAAQLVAGDVIELAAGNLVPADGVVLQAHDLLVNQASLTGESFPVEKQPGCVAAATTLSARTNCVHLGSSVRSGTGTVLLVQTGRNTVLADLAAHLAHADDTTGFERGVRRFGELLLRVMFVVVVAVLALNTLLGRPVVESLLFALALAVGLSPELLPAIVSICLARGARRLAAGGVLVRRLDAIEDLGTMDTLCTDKTGTLTVGTMALAAAVDRAGQPSAEVLRLAHLNAAFETGIANPIDDAIVAAAQRAGLATGQWRKVDEIPYDFVRRRLAIVVAHEDDPARHLLVVKGAVAQVLTQCTLDARAQEAAQAYAREQGRRGVRVLALATRTGPAQARYTKDDERDLTLHGFLCFADPAKPDAAAALQALARRGVQVKIVTGDTRHVAAHLAAKVGLDGSSLVTGEQLAAMRDEALWHLAARTHVFAEVEPAQKARIVRALQRAGRVVGYLGDGINDAPALQAADVGISVDRAADVARESADLVLLQPDLGVLERGVAEGRRTFANTLKYIRITISANFGNMVSMALAAPLLPFLPLTATQILLNNLLSDLPALLLPGDRVDEPSLRRPQRWNMAEVRRFMLVFGLVSSAFDLLTFVLLLRVFEAEAALFRSGWFAVSLLTELAVLLVLRTQLVAWRSRPSPLLVGASAAVALVALALPFAGPLATLLGFVPMPAPVMAAVVGITLAYAVATEAAKRWFWRAHTHEPAASARVPA